MININFKYTVLACLFSFSVAAYAAPEPEMVAIKGGNFERSDGTIEVSAFSMGATEVTRGLWDTVWDWANTNGYELTPARGLEANRPVWTVNWYDCLKWCNALSEMQGLQPAYYTDAEHQTVYRTGELDLKNAMVDWKANGFRLPTESEWEYAYRAGTTSNYYWGEDDFMIWDPPETPWRKYSQGYMHRLQGMPQPVAQKLPNAWGLFDMAGNAEEWCWDCYDLDYVDDKHGSDVEGLRVLRGGSTALDNQYYQQAFYRGRCVPYYRFNNIGFRIASSNPKAALKIKASPAPSLALRNERSKIRFGQLSNDPDAVAYRFFKHINLTTAGLEQVRALYEDGAFQDALDAYRDWFIAKHSENHAELKDCYVVMTGDYGNMFNLRPPLIYYHNDPAFYNNPTTYRFGEYFAEQYEKSKNFRYVEKYFELTDDYARNGRRQYFELTDIGLGKHYAGPDFTSMWPQHWEYGDGLDSVRQPRCMANQLYIMFCNLPESDIEKVSSIALANQLTFLVECCLSAAISNGKECVPNQIKHIATELIAFSREWNEFKDAPVWYRIGADRMEYALTKGDILPDGGDMEQSFGYNIGNLYATDEVNQFLSDLDEQPQWLKNVNETALKRLRMFAGLVMPSGVCPAVAERPAYHIWYHTRHFKRWLKIYDCSVTKSVADQIFNDGKGNLPEPAFTSIAYPYSGYYALRDSWRPDALYLFLKACRDGRGHFHQDENGIELSAYGRHMLVDAGGTPYTHTTLPDWQKIDADWLIAFTHYFGANTLLVDGAPQTCWNSTVPKVAYTEPILARWHASDLIDFTEGFYNDGYQKVYEGPTEQHWHEIETIFSDKDKYGDPAEQEAVREKMRAEEHPEFEALHQRQVIFLKKLGLWLVVDRVDGGSERTAIWQFAPPVPEKPLYKEKLFVPMDEPLDFMPICMPGFAEDQVVVTPENNTVKTCDPNGANMVITAINDTPLKYERFFGQKYPHRGWINVEQNYIPAVRVETNWSGDAPMITLLRPCNKGVSTDYIKSMKTQSGENTNGFDAILPDGTRIICRSAKGPTQLTCGNLKGKASLLLHVTTPKNETYGLALDASGIKLGGKSMKASPNFTFDQSGVTTPITIPETFRWTKTPEGQKIPAYH